MIFKNPQLKSLRSSARRPSKKVSDSREDMLITSLQESKMDQEFSSRWLAEFNTDIKFDKNQMKLRSKKFDNI